MVRKDDSYRSDAYKRKTQQQHKKLIADVAKFFYSLITQSPSFEQSFGQGTGICTSQPLTVQIPGEGGVTREDVESSIRSPPNA